MSGKNKKVTKKQNKPMNQMFEFAGSKKNSFYSSIVLSVLGVAAGLVPYLIVARIISNLIEGKTDFKVYLSSCVICLIAYIIKILLMYVADITSHTAAFETLANMRKAITGKLTRVPMGYVQNTPSGVIQDTIVDKVEGMERFLSHMMPDMVSGIVVPIILLIYLFTIDIKLAFISLIAIPVSIVCMAGMFVGYTENFNRFLAAGKHMSATVVEYVRGIEVIKIFNQSSSSYLKYTDAVNDDAAAAYNWMKGVQFFWSLSFTVMPSVLVTTLPIGLMFYANGSVAASEFISIAIVAMGIVGPLLSIMKYSDAMPQLESLMDDINKIMDVSELDRPEKPVKLNRMTIEMKNVSFSYNADKRNLALKNVSLQIEPNTVNALVGPSGGGKSTIGKLIAGFWDPSDGEIRISNVDLRRIPQRQLADTVTYVSQDNYLFNTTIMENIRMGNPNATDQDVINVAKSCGCDEFIRALENGYQTVVGSGGGHLSGGERQRIAIARAMLKDAPIVIFDEATSSTDPENEAEIQDALDKLIEGKTIIVIAHRLSTIINADQIFVVKEGMIENSGKHEDLLHNSSLYKSLWDAYQSNSQERM